MTGAEIVAMVRGGMSWLELSPEDTKAYWAEIMRPKFLRMVGKWRANNCSFGMAFDRSSIEDGTFGSVAPYWCDNCGPQWEAPEYHMTYRQTLESPEEGEDYCQGCNCSECCGKNEEGHGTDIKQVRRYTIYRISKADRLAYEEIRNDPANAPLLEALKPITTRIA